MFSASRKYSATVSPLKRDAQTRARRFRHLAVDQRGARLLQVLHVDDAALLELEPEVVAFARALADTGEHRDAAVLHRDVVDQLLDDDGLADAGAAEQPDLAAAQVRLEQVDDLDAGLEHLQLGRLILERRRGAVNRPALGRLDRTIGEVDRLAEHVHDAAERRGADRHRDRRAGVDDLHAAAHAVGRLHRDGADAVLAEVLLDLADDVDGLAAGPGREDPDRVVDGRQVPGLELDVDDRSDDLDDLADFLVQLLLLLPYMSRRTRAPRLERGTQSHVPIRQPNPTRRIASGFSSLGIGAGSRSGFGASSVGVV